MLTQAIILFVFVFFLKQISLTLASNIDYLGIEFINFFNLFFIGHDDPNREFHSLIRVSLI